jgi:aryl-alcohol dehydrogenase-like predicted oxidoreductase
MEYRELGRTGIKVSVLCLGTMTFGEQNSERDGHAQLDYAAAQGINFVDASEIYPIPPKPETQGRTESIIGTWLASRKNRDKTIVATKVAGRGKMSWLRKDAQRTRQSASQIMEAVDASLARLKTDYVDLYQLHWPDRPMRIFEGLDYLHLEGESHPIHDILAVLGNLVEAGKVRFVGLSNETPWGVMSFLKASEQHGLPRIASIQNAYNLVNRSYETRLSEITYREQVSLLGYSPLGQGYLTGNMKAVRSRPIRARRCSTGSAATRRRTGPRPSRPMSRSRAGMGSIPRRWRSPSPPRGHSSQAPSSARPLLASSRPISLPSISRSRITCLRTSSRSILTIRTHALDCWGTRKCLPCPACSPPSRSRVPSPTDSRSFARGLPARAGSIPRIIT